MVFFFFLPLKCSTLDYVILDILFTLCLIPDFYLRFKKYESRWENSLFKIYSLVENPKDINLNSWNS